MTNPLSQPPVSERAVSDASWRDDAGSDAGTVWNVAAPAPPVDCPVRVDFPWAPPSGWPVPLPVPSDRRSRRDWVALTRRWADQPYGRPRSAADWAALQEGLSALEHHTVSATALRGVGLGLVMLGCFVLFIWAGAVADISKAHPNASSWSLLLTWLVPSPVVLIGAVLARCNKATARARDAVETRLCDLRRAAPTATDVGRLRKITAASSTVRAQWAALMAHATETGVPVLNGDIKALTALEATVDGLTDWSTVLR